MQRVLNTNPVVHIPTKKYLLFSIFVSVLIGVLLTAMPSLAHPNLLGAEVFILIIALFVFSTIRYRIDNKILTYGALPILSVTFLCIWWPQSPLRVRVGREGVMAVWDTLFPQLISLHRLENLIHADTMLFILGLTFFVSVISQTRILETISMAVLHATRGHLFTTVVILISIVSFASGILDGVSMIGLTIRILVIILIMAKIQSEEIGFFIAVSVIITTVCGMWLAYGEPPNLIMKSNLGLSDLFFLKHTLPMAVVALVLVIGFIYPRLKGKRVALKDLGFLEKNIADIRFLQVMRHGHVKEVEEMLEKYETRLADQKDSVWALYHKGHHPIHAMVLARVAPETVQLFVTEYLGEEFVGPVLFYYQSRAEEEKEREVESGGAIWQQLSTVRHQRNRAVQWGAIALLPFIGLLLWHGQNHDVPLFLSSVVAFVVSFVGIGSHPKIRKKLVLDAVHEYQEYLFLFPLFFSVTLLTEVGFFDPIKLAIVRGAEEIGSGHLAAIQFVGAALLSAMLDNNVVADFASRAITHTPDLFLFAAAQIAGYATGGALTHIGSAQSVVAYAYIVRYINRSFTPLDWVRIIWKLILTLSVTLVIVIYIMGAWMAG